MVYHDMAHRCGKCKHFPEKGGKRCKEQNDDEFPRRRVVYALDYGCSEFKKPNGAV